MQKALLISRARVRNNSQLHEQGETEVSRLVDVESEQRKYDAFWTGVRRGVMVDSRNPKVVDSIPSRRAVFSKENPTYITDPAGPLKLSWDLIVAVVVLISVILVPLRLGFEEHETSQALIILEWIMTAIFAVDLCLNFNTAYVDEKQSMVYSRRRIARRYLGFWFWIDFVSTVPLDNIIGIFASASALANLRALKVLRMFRLFKLFHIFQLGEMIQSLKIPPLVLVVLTVMAQIFFLAHIFACFWHYIALPSGDDQPRTWLTEFDFEKENMYERYIASMYYIIMTMLTIGYGDIHPTNDVERFYSIITMLTGGVVFGAMISRLATVIEKRNPEAKALTHHMTELKKFLKEISLPQDTRHAVMKAYSYYFSKKSAYGEPAFFQDLPPAILYRLMRQMCEDDIKSIKLLHTYEMDFVVPLLLNMTPMFAKVGEQLYGEGDLMSSIVFLKRGKVNLSISDGVSDVLIGSVNSGGYFGDFEYLRRTTSLCNYTVAKHCVMVRVSHVHFHTAAQRCLDGGVRFRQEIEKRFDNFSSQLEKAKSQSRVQEMSLEEARQEVEDKLSAKPMPQLSRQKSNHEPRMSLNIMSGKSTRSTKSGGRSGKARRRSNCMPMSMWIDGALVDSRNYLLVGLKSMELAPEDEVDVVRVISDNQNRKFRVMEVEEAYLTVRFIIHPLSQMKIMWDGMIGMIIVFAMISVPVEVAFGESIGPWTDETEIAIASLFLTDMVVTARTAVYVPDDDGYIIDGRKILECYLSRWFLVDLLGSLPFNLILGGGGEGGGFLRFLAGLKVLRLVRLLKLTRVVKLGNLVEELEERFLITPALFDMLLMLLEVLVVGHVVCCVLWGVSGVFSNDPWYDHTELVYTDMDQAHLGTKYLTSLYWTFTIMSTVGYGDIYPINTSERILNIFVIVIGASIFGYMLANVSGSLQTLNASEGEEQMQSVEAYLDEKQCAPKLRDAVTKHLRNFYKSTHMGEVDALLGRLPDSLANEIRLIHHEVTLKRIALLNYIDNVSVRLHVFSLMRPMFFEPNGMMILEGAEADNIMFMVDGSAVAFKKVRKIRVLRKSKSTKRVKEIFKNIFHKVRGISRSSKSKDKSRTSFQNSPPDSSPAHSPSHASAPMQKAAGAVMEGIGKIGGRRGLDRHAARSKLAWRTDKETAEADEGAGGADLGASAVDVESEGDSGNSWGKEGKGGRWGEGDKGGDGEGGADRQTHSPSFGNQEERKPSETPPSDRTDPAMYLDPASGRYTFADPASAHPDPASAFSFASIFAASPHNSDDFQEMESDEPTTPLASSTHTTRPVPPPPLPHLLHPRDSHSHDPAQDEKYSEDETPSPTPRPLADPTHFETHTVAQLITPTLRKNKSFRVTPDRHDEEEGEEETCIEKWGPDDFSHHGLQLIGPLNPGDFMGHMGLLHRCAHNVSVAATSLTTVYVLSKSDIAKLLAEQPTLSQQLQMALARAIATQSDIVGRMHMRSSRAEFLKSVKMRFYKHHDIDKKDVERVNKMMASRITQIKRSVSHVRQSVSFSRVPTAEHRSKDKAVVSLSEFDSERQCEPDSVRESRLGKGDESVGGGGGGWSGGTHVDDGLRNTSFDSRVAMPQGVGMGQTVGGLAQGSEQGLGQGHDVGDPGDASMGSPGGLGWVGIAGGEGEAEAEGLGLGMVGWPLSIDVPSDGDLGSHIDTPAPLRRQWSPNLFSLHGMGMGGMGMGGMGMGGMSMGGMGMGSTGMSMENTLEGICMRNMGIMGGGPQHRLSRDQLRSIKTLERVLGTEYTSDDDADADMVRGVIPIRHLLDPPHTHHHNHIHPTVHTPRAPLPAAQMLRSANLHPRPRVHSSTRKSLRLRKGPHPADEPPSIIGMLSLLLPEEAPAPHEQFRGIARTMSLSDIDMLDTLDAQQDGLQNPRNARRPSYGEEVEKTRSPSELLVPIWSNRRALHAPTLVRRQSFPSLDHQLWRTSKTAQGLL